MTTTVDTTATIIDASAPPALTPDLQAIVQAAQVYAAQAAAYLATARQVLTTTEQVAAQAVAAQDVISAELIGLSGAAITAFLTALPTARPATSGVLWNDNDVISVS